MAKIMDLLEELEVLEALRVKTEDAYINNILFYSLKRTMKEEQAK